MASRPTEEQALSEFLDSVAGAPSALLVDGEAGIGKTTLWLAALERARDRGFQVLSARVARADEAEPLVDALERNGRKQDRPWMLAVGARCRAMVQAARGDVEAAVHSAHRALTEHDRLPMPFERARTQLLLGQLTRRERSESTSVLRDALAVFEELGAVLWANRARAELAGADAGRRTTAQARTHQGLTPAEQRVAELAASGMTNRDVAGKLFISSKTVEATLARVYRKLGIRSRAELGQRMRETAT